MSTAEEKNWSGDRKKQVAMTMAIMRAFRGTDPVDLMATMETIIANMLCDIAATEKDALNGLDMVIDDLKRTIAQRFENKGK